MGRFPWLVVSVPLFERSSDLRALVHWRDPDPAPGRRAVRSGDRDQRRSVGAGPAVPSNRDADSSDPRFEIAPRKYAGLVDRARYAIRSEERAVGRDRVRIGQAHGPIADSFGAGNHRDVVGNYTAAVVDLDDHR